MFDECRKHTLHTLYYIILYSIILYVPIGYTHSVSIANANRRAEMQREVFHDVNNLMNKISYIIYYYNMGVSRLKYLIRFSSGLEKMYTLSRKPLNSIVVCPFELSSYYTRIYLYIILNVLYTHYNTHTTTHFI